MKTWERDDKMQARQPETLFFFHPSQKKNIIVGNAYDFYYFSSALLPHVDISFISLSLSHL